MGKSVACKILCILFILIELSFFKVENSRIMANIQDLQSNNSMVTEANEMLAGMGCSGCY